MGYLLYSLLSLPVIINIILIIHVIKTDRERSWIFILFIFPGIGALVYFLTEILPDLLHHPAARRAGGSIVRRATSSGRLKRLLREAAFAPTFVNRRAVADEYFFQALFPEAAEWYARCLADFDDGNLEVRLALAQCHFNSGDYEKALTELDRLKDAPGLFKKYSSDLLLARTLEKAGRFPEADAAYADLAPRFPGFEAFARYGLFLLASGDRAKARVQFMEIINQYPLLPRVNRREQYEWVRLARMELRKLKATDQGV
jgi:hypothetical protein